MKKQFLGKLEVSSLGLGCMGMSEFYGEADEALSIQTLEQAIALGITLLDTADMYGSGRNEELVGRVIRPLRDRVVLATKFGIVRKPEDPTYRATCGKPDYVRRQCESSLKRLGVETIDLYYQHRVDPEVPIEETVEAMAGLVREGKVRYLGVSEATEEQLRRAHAVHPIAALQTEYSLWSRGPEEGILQTCEELGIGFVAYSPIGRGFLSGRFRSQADFPRGDCRSSYFPRFQGDNLQHNLTIVKTIEAMALRKGCTPSQLALAWVLAQGPSIVPIFGTTRPDHLKENIASLEIQLSEQELEQLSSQIPHEAAHGERYPTSMRTYGLKR